jgi:aminotransferase in exopolysaccharide biosynthesis
MIPLSEPVFGGNEWKYVKECLDTGWVSSVGKFVDQFEEAICRYTGARFAVATVNGTAALHIALLVAGVKPGDEVIVPTITFIAPVNAVRYVGAFPVFMDCDAYFNLDVEKVREFLETETVLNNGKCYNRKTGRRIAAIIPVHVFGNPVDLEPLLAVCQDRNIRIIEDATESLGTRYSQGRLKGKHTGTVGDLGCFSFNGNKIITTGGGGMIVTDSASFAQRARYLTTQAKDDPLYYIHNEIGYNYRLTNVLAAIGLAQLEQLDTFISIRKKNFRIYREAISEIGTAFSLLEPPPYAEANFWLYTLEISPETGLSRDGVLRHLLAHNIQARPVWLPNHLQEMYRDFQAFKVERAVKKYNRALNIPSSASLRQEDIRIVADTLKKMVQKVC